MSSEQVRVKYLNQGAAVLLNATASRRTPSDHRLEQQMPLEWARRQLGRLVLLTDRVMTGVCCWFVCVLLLKPLISGQASD